MPSDSRLCVIRHIKRKKCDFKAGSQGRAAGLVYECERSSGIVSNLIKRFLKTCRHPKIHNGYHLATVAEKNCESQVDRVH